MRSSSSPPAVTSTTSTEKPAADSPSRSRSPLSRRRTAASARSSPSSARCANGSSTTSLIVARSYAGAGRGGRRWWAGNTLHSPWRAPSSRSEPPSRCFVGGLALAVFLTRDEDNIQVDNLLSERFTREVATASADGTDLDLAEIAPFEWARVLIVAPGTPDAEISRALGYEWTGVLGFETGEKLILLDRDGKVERFFDYRGEGRFAGVDDADRRARARGCRLPGTPPGDHAEGVTLGRLDELDLSADLSKKEAEAAPEGRAGADAGAAPGARRARRRARASGRRCASCSRAGTRAARAARSSAWWPSSTRGTCASSSTRPRRPTSCATRGCGASGRRCRAGAGWRSSTAPGTAACSSSASRASRREEEWRRAYDEINAFERMLADEGTVLVKLWLHLSDEEQLERFEARQDDPLKAYKLTDEDWRNRGKRAAYCEAIEEMLERTDTEWAPWHLVEGDSKRFARVKVVETVIAAAEDGLARHGHRPCRAAAASAWPSCGAPCAPGAARGPSRAPWPWPGARACAGPRRAGGRRAGGRAPPRRGSSARRARSSMPTSSSATADAAADDPQRRACRCRRSSRRRARRVGAGVGCGGGIWPSNGLPSWASAAAGASRTRARVRMARR